MNCFDDYFCLNYLLKLLINVMMTLLAKLSFRFLFRINSLFVFVLPMKNYSLNPYFDCYFKLFCLDPNYDRHLFF